MCYETHTFHSLADARVWLLREGFSAMASTISAEFWSDGVANVEVLIHDSGSVTASINLGE